jgi:flavin-dependent dehydrogenase
LPAGRVVIVGGGPGGSICAARLAQRGCAALVLEKARHPRFHLGESLLPCSLGVLEAVGVLEEVRARFLVKNAARFVEDATGRTARYAFSDAYSPRHTHAFQVPRDEFDELLFRHAGRAGADVREGWTVTRIVFEDGRARGVEARDPEGHEHTIEADIVVDASGRDAIVARGARSVDRLPGLDRTALYTQFRGAWRDAGDREGDIQIVVVPEGWFWFIPFRDGRTSVGAVMSSAWIRAHKGGARTDDTGPEALFRSALESTPSLSRMLEGATQLFPAGAAADYSFKVDSLAGDGWLAVGDSGGFIDPLFSTGAHLAMEGALRAADEIALALEAQDTSRARFQPWEHSVHEASRMFLGAVQAFYSGELVPLLFKEPQHPYLRRAITSMLAGAVFDEDAPWARDLRRRFPARTKDPI